MSQWISVKDELPREGERVLVWYDDRPIRGRYAAPRVMVGSYVVDQLRPEGWNGDHRPEITHWMPLPAPPSPVASSS